MLAKEMSLKITSNYILILVVALFACSISKATENVDHKIANYFLELKNFSSQFIQTDGASIEEGILYIGEERLRVEYINPSKILLIMDENKAMYHNYDLQETEFFNPENTSAWVFLEIFKNKDFFHDMKKVSGNKNIILSKKLIINEIKYNLEIYFEMTPLILRKIKLLYNDELLEISLSNHNFNELFDKKFFKMISPDLLN